jgi:hypothetical protein
MLMCLSEDKKLIELEILDASNIVEMKDLALSGLGISKV